VINAFILDCKKEIKEFRAATIDVDLPVIAADVLIETLIDILNEEKLDNSSVYVAAGRYIAKTDMYIQYDTETTIRLYSAMLKLAGAIRNKLRQHHAYVDGQFPFTFTKSFHHGTLYLTRKREAASTIAHHPRHTGGGV